MKLVIVESPAKAKTISKFLGKEYEVVASYGHIRDLPSSAAEVPSAIKDKPWARMAVDIDNDFTPHYVVQKDSKKRIAELKKKMKEAEEVVLATDEDREGESISWHLLETLQPKVPVRRIAFHEITSSAIKQAIEHPRDVNTELVRAQEGRRILDRLYGYELSPVLWRKVRPKLSAGRVQSVAVRIVVEREEARKAFHVAPYWDLEATLSRDGTAFQAVLHGVDGKRLATGKDFDGDTGGLKSKDVYWLREEAEARALAQALEAGLPWRVANVERKAVRQRPQPPFITSTLQQAASSQLGFSPTRTMQVAQRLYEGVDLGGGDREGLITYMRTDSQVLADKALHEAGQVIREHYGERYHQGPRHYTTKSRMAQEAHEAIRPTVLARRPEELAAYLSDEERRLYSLIWRRTLASQMADAELEKTAITIAAEADDKQATFRANGSVVTFPGFLAVSPSGTNDTVLPPVEEGQQVGPDQPLTLDGLQPQRHETKPPARFTEASLVRRLEEEGIGRPSTYAPTISTIQARGYVEKIGSALAPTFLGVAVTNLLRRYFGDYVDYGFTARMEEALDAIAEGRQDWKAFLRSFYRGEGQFGDGLKQAIEGQMEHIEFPAIPLGEDGEGRPIVVRLGKNAPFVQRGEGGAENVASIPDDVTFEELDVAKAEELLAAKARGNEALGQHPETGENIYALLGPYGPYVQLGEQGEDRKVKPKRASLPKGTHLEDVTLETALKYLSLPRELGEHPDDGKKVKAAIGRFGPYVQCDREFRSVKAPDDVFTIELPRALELLAQPKAGRGATKKVLRELGDDPKSGVKLTIYEGRYGPYVSDGNKNASLPKDADPQAFTIEQAAKLLANAPAKKKAAPRKRKASAKKASAKKS